MACFHPLQAYQKPGGGRLQFRCPTPDMVGLLIPCGQCIGCRVDRSRAWAARIMHESQCHAASCFLTLTYDPDKLPGAAVDDIRQPGLYPKDFQVFIRALRKKLKVPLRYFMCGEYGEKFGRPHYHACLFGFDFSGDRVLFKKGNSGCDIYTSEVLSSVWTDGFASVGQLSFESAAYVARYVCKKVTGDKAETHYGKLSLATGEIYVTVPEFARMSLKPGIGSDWYKQFAGDVFPHDYVVMNGCKVKPPRFYDKRLEIEWPDEYMALKARRLERAMACVDDCSPVRLKTREVVFRAGLAFKSRSLE